jgi:glutathione S-transferase
MSLTLYSGSGSPYAWRAQLGLEHKALPYDLRMISFSAGDTRKPEFLAMNPRHQVPVLVDDDFSLYESNAIVEYLEDAYPGRGAPLFPGNARQRAIVRRLVQEVDHYFDPATDMLIDQAFSKKPDERDPALIEEGKAAIAKEYALFTQAMRGEFLAGPLSAADFALYPFVAFVARCAIKLPQFDPDALLTPELRAWKARIEALPFLDRTIPPHWKKTS